MCPTAEKFLWSITAASICFVFATCDPGGGGGSTAAPAPVTFEEFGESFNELYGDATCEALWSCPEWRNLRAWTQDYHSQFSSPSECQREATVSYFRQWYGISDDAIDQGRTIYDEDAGGECLRALGRNLTDQLCGAPDAQQAIDEACAQVFTGTFAEDELCLKSYECQGSLVCGQVSGECYGRCEEISGLRRCGEGPPCDDDQYCSLPDEVCTPVRDSGDSCTSNMQCGEFRFCHDGQCRAQRSASKGQPCGSHRICARGLTCQDGQCRSASPGEVGSRCYPFDPPFCQPGRGCRIIEYGYTPETFEAVCVALEPEGGPCTWSNECQAGLYCDTPIKFEEEGVCARRLEIGASCDRNLVCQSLKCDYISENGGAECVDAHDWTNDCELP